MRTILLSAFIVISTQISANALADELNVKLVSIASPVHPGGVVTLAIQTQPGAQCVGARQGHYGNAFSIKLTSQTAGSDGLAQWKWSVLSGNHPIGLRGVHVNCTVGDRQGSLDTSFDVR